MNKPCSPWAYVWLSFMLACFISEVFIFHHVPGIIIWEAAFIIQALEILRSREEG